MKNSSLRKKLAGFTLLEILIALFIFAILSLMLSAALRSVISAQEGTELNAVRLRDLQFTLLMISRDIEQAMDRPVWNASGKEEKAFIGSSRGFTLTHAGSANVEGSQAKSALQRSRYEWRENLIWRKTWPVLDQAPSSSADRRPLLNQVSAVHFQYMDQDNHFHPEWPYSNEAGQSLPRAVRIELQIQHWGSVSQLYVIPVQIKPKTQATQADKQS